MILSETEPIETMERQIWVTAKCETCQWGTSLPTSILRFASSSLLLFSIAQKHEKEYKGHTVQFKQA